MTYQEIWQVFVNGLFPISLPFILSCLIFSVLCSLFSKQSFRFTFPILLAFGFLGGVSGLSAGLSREPVIGTVIPAMLTLVSGVLGYLFSKEHLKDWRVVIPFCIFILTLNTCIGLFLGSQMRGKSEEYEKQYNEWLLHYEKVDLELEKQQELQQKDEEIDKK